ncbi:flagellar hook-length control protein FliK [Arenibacterium sp. LLYu02]|uniref:flagellar hook-length control protein FliK n=1 Tax=Arenibacterium sp. LLYu02 TaxID=3404132 RepID=UPI003B21E77F
MRGAPNEAAKPAPNERGGALSGPETAEDTAQPAVTEAEVETTDEEGLPLEGAPLSEEEQDLTEDEDVIEVPFVASEGPAPSEHSLIPSYLVPAEHAAEPTPDAAVAPSNGDTEVQRIDETTARSGAPVPGQGAPSDASQQIATPPANVTQSPAAKGETAEADLSESVAAAGATQEEAEQLSEDGMLQQKAVLQEVTSQRKGVSTVLEAHRDALREQRAGLETTSQTTASRSEAQVAEAAFQARSQREGEAESQLPREAAQTLTAPVATPQPNKPQVSGAVRAAGSTVPLHSAATGAVQTSSSAVVTSIMAAGEASVTGEDVLTQRGFDSIALPQLIAEASVRSGAATYRAETPRHVAQQLAEAVATAGRRHVDVSLNPVELGRVSMRLATHDTGVTVVIQVERPETEELMRRHIQDLAREFKEMGFTDISFQFGSDARADTSENGTSQGQGQGTLSTGDGEALAAEETNLPIAQQLNIAASGLDMRV